MVLSQVTIKTFRDTSMQNKVFRLDFYNQKIPNFELQG